MAKDLVQQPRPTNIALPDAPGFMEADGQMGTTELQAKIRPPFLRLIQKQSSDELHAQFGIGALILSPDNIMVVEPAGAPVRIIPIFFYSEFLKLAPIALKDQEQFIAARSTDPASNIARRCQNKELWFEDHPKYPGDASYQYRYAEALNFACIFNEPHLPPSPFILSFQRGSYGVGQKFCNLVNMRQKPLFGCVFHLSVDPTLMHNAKGDWRVPLMANPPERPWVDDAEQYALCRQLHDKLRMAFAGQELETQYDVETESTSAVNADRFA